jgi:hypothetical protein
MAAPRPVPLAVRRLARRLLHVYSDATLAAMILVARKPVGRAGSAKGT